MPTIYDNIDADLLDTLKTALTGSRRGDFCVGYFNLRGWRKISAEIDAIPLDESANESPPACRLIVGMSSTAERAVRTHYNHAETEPTNKIINTRKHHFAESLMTQLTYGTPTAQDEAGLRKLAKQLRAGRLQVKFFGRYSLHAKLYLVHRDDGFTPIIGYVGSSNLTLSGLEKQGELNVDVLEQDAAQKLAKWFEDRWDDNWCLDISTELAEIIENSWAGGAINPYEIYIKTAYELSREAIQGSRDFKVPSEFDEVMLEFQKHAVSLAAERLCHSHRGVIIGDVVGLGKTLIACAVAKTFQEDHGDNVLIICPPKLEKMWGDYMHKYNIAGKTLSLGKIKKLRKERRYRLIVIDESHNLRNRTAKRYGHVRDYIRQNESRVILLTATPYNKQFSDIANQLRLFLDTDTDLGIRPDDYIAKLGGIDQFRKNHPNALTSSLAAFEHSESIDDWRELMRMFMVRRTRSHIQKNYAEEDLDRKQYYLTFADGKRFYFPERTSKCAKFAMDTQNELDQYALLYSKPVVDIISKLTLPRYGVGKYLLPEYQKQKDADFDALSAEQQTIIKNLGRAGARLIGFAKSSLYKRLESSGQAFLLSIQRHIIRNAVYLSALEQENGKFPIGDAFASLTDETLDGNETNHGLIETNSTNPTEIEHYLAAGNNVYKKLSNPKGNLFKKFDWIDANLFNDSLRKDLLSDSHALLKILNKVHKWDDATDRKLDALVTLCTKTHPTEKLLVFTQFKDTADYLHDQLAKRGVTQIAEAYGNMDDISKVITRFSPYSNGATSAVDEVRVLITTDTLSEGQNLQDAHIIVNFDMPWALIRLVQRAGRVDRIGQQAREILCYCFLPEDGIENIIELRDRLQQRIQQNAELVGSDEVFFDDNTINIEQVYEETIVLEELDDETDLVSRAYDIWRQATKDNPELKARIEKLPNVVYSSKQSQTDSGALAYVKTNTAQHILAQVNQQGEVVSQSQSKVLRLLECLPDEPIAKTAENHHELVAQAVSYIKTERLGIGGQLGTAGSIRSRVYARLMHYQEKQEGTIFHSEELKYAIEQIHAYPFQETTRDRLVRQLRAKISDHDLQAMILALWKSDDLVVMPKNDEPVEPHIICSMGLVS